LFQGAASEYVVPLLLVGSVDGSFCTSEGMLEIKVDISFPINFLNKYFKKLAYVFYNKRFV